uniref:Uncharacterized protein n=1 Tax=viral metagenome TaxID=1070528 RepID=A0A6C0F675_9ZZZZ|tara:strand:+ start:2662 stop:3105 length:444 start_codon:yes stop_codon:yes gene_type:complete
MSQDISYIRNELNGFYEIESVYDINIGDIVKYITIDINDDEEYFHDGGKYIRMGDNVIYVDNGKITPVPIKHLNPDGSLIYKTRIFIKSDEIVNEEITEYEKIINNQQNIIEGITKQNIKLKEIVTALNEKNKKYKEALRKLVEAER